MSEIPSDVSPALLESPTAHGAVLGGLCPWEAAEICLEFWQEVLAHNLFSVQKRLPRVQVWMICNRRPLPLGSLGMLQPCKNHPRGKCASNKSGWEMACAWDISYSPLRMVRQPGAERPAIPAEALNTGRRQLPLKQSRRQVKTSPLGAFSHLAGYKSSESFPGLGEHAWNLLPPPPARKGWSINCNTQKVT